jgi:hypothetical protein
VVVLVVWTLDWVVVLDADEDCEITVVETLDEVLVCGVDEVEETDCCEEVLERDEVLDEVTLPKET